MLHLLVSFLRSFPTCLWIYNTTTLTRVTHSHSGPVSLSLSLFLSCSSDDYANCLIAGETMRPLTDLLYVSREKLAFIVDATAAPIASIVPVSSWVGFEVGLIQAEIDRKLETMSAMNHLSLGASCSHMLHPCHFVTRCQAWPLSRAG
jgi:hypothetical protein